MQNCSWIPYKKVNMKSDHKLLKCGPFSGLVDGRLTVVELFAGVGGFRCGLEEQHPDYFKTIWANQWEPGRKNQFAFDCYNHHFENKSKNINADIATVIDDVPPHDLLVGGFPCQDYSVAATKAKGIEGKKGVLWWSIRDIICKHHPKYILLENVDRLVKSPVSQRGRDFAIILRCLADEKYYVEWRIINAADYGFQQKRRRTFIFACLESESFSKKMANTPDDKILTSDGYFAVPFPVSKEKIDTKSSHIDISKSKYPELTDVSNNFEATFYNSGFMRGHEIYTKDMVPNYSGPKKTLREILETDVEERFYVSDEELVRWKEAKNAKRLIRKHKDGTTYIYAEGAIPFPDNLDIAGRTMLTSEGSLSRSSHLIQDPQTGRYRILTPVECERLNGFQDGWTNTGMTDRQRYFTMGNALVVPLIKLMGERLIMIDDNCQESVRYERQPLPDYYEVHTPIQ